MTALRRQISTAAGALSLEDAREALRDPAAWVRGVVAEPQPFDVTTARIMLGCRVRDLAPAVPRVQVPIPGEPPPYPCARYGEDRVMHWSAGGGKWVAPPPCDGVRCGYAAFLEGRTVAPGSAAELEDDLEDLRGEAWAFRHWLPGQVARNERIVATLELWRDVLERVAEGEGDPAELADLAAAALEPGGVARLLEDRAPVRMIPATLGEVLTRPRDLVALEREDAAGPPHLVERRGDVLERVVRRTRANGPLARLVRSWIPSDGEK